MAGLLSDLVHKDDVLFISFILEKKEYLHSYLNAIRKNKDQLDAKYSDTLQISNFIGKLVKKYCIDLDSAIDVTICRLLLTIYH